MLRHLLSPLHILTTSIYTGTLGTYCRSKAYIVDGKYESFWQEISVDSLLLKWLLRPMGLLLVKKCVITRLWWIDRWYYTARGDTRGYIKSTSEYLLYVHDKQAIVFFFIYPYVSCYNHFMTVRLHLDEQHKIGI